MSLLKVLLNGLEIWIYLIVMYFGLRVRCFNIQVNIDNS